MFRIFRPALLILLFAVLCTPVGATINVAVAANMQYAMKEIIAAYKAKTGKDVTAIYGSAGKLSAQILNGAPFDVFVSADMNRGDSLFAKGFAVSQSRNYSSGLLVLWTLRDDLDLSTGLQVLQDPSVKSVALGDLKLTIYGPAAQQAIVASGLWKAVQPKVVYGENINLVAQYIVNRSCDIGFANKSFTQQGPMAGKGKWVEVDPSLYGTLQQGAVILRYGQDNNPGEAKGFFDFLFGNESRAILSKHGYLLP